MEQQIAIEGLRRLVARARVPRAPRESRSLRWIVRQGVCLALRHHLQAVLEPAEKHVRLGQLVAVAAGDEPGEEQALERRQGASRAQVRVLASMQEL